MWSPPFLTCLLSFVTRTHSIKTNFPNVCLLPWIEYNNTVHCYASRWKKNWIVTKWTADIESKENCKMTKSIDNELGRKPGTVILEIDRYWNILNAQCNPPSMKHKTKVIHPILNMKNKTIPEIFRMYFSSKSPFSHRFCPHIREKRS